MTHIQTITNLAQLKSKFQEAEQMREISDDAFRKATASWCLSPTIFGEIPADPFSAEFRTFQLGIYEQLAGEEYSTTNEETVFDFEHELLWPYPYGTKSAKTVGLNLMGYGWIIRKMDLPPESRILEIGSGYGTLTVHLASMGYQVTCLDINESFLSFIKTRTSRFPQQVKTICGDMATVKIDGTFDAIIFNASLHHSLEHRSVIKRLNSVLSSDGIIAFISEPVVTESSKYVPYPWGIRLDGLSVWSIYKWGWLELGFQESYFIDFLNDAGWNLKRHNLGLSGLTDVWIASKSNQTNSTSVSAPHHYDTDAETEVIRLREIVAGYEQGRFIRFTRWIKGYR